jgi:hypothetical protein
VFIKNPSWEYTILLILGAYADKPVDLDQLEHQVSISKLELLAISKKLHLRGLVSENTYSETLISLTTRGRKYVMNHQSKRASA